MNTFITSLKQKKLPVREWREGRSYKEENGTLLFISNVEFSPPSNVLTPSSIVSSFGKSNYHKQINYTFKLSVLGCFESAASDINAGQFRKIDSKRKREIYP